MKKSIKNVLVIEDDPDVLDFILMALEEISRDFKIITASDNENINNAVAEHVPDLIILDLMMPELDGFSVLDALKVNQNTANIPVIVVTAKTLTIQEKERLTGSSFLQDYSLMS